MNDARQDITELMNRGVDLTKTSQAATAEPLLQEALTRAETELGPEDPLVVLCLNALGEWHRFAGRFAEAEPPLRRALALSEAIQGENHGDTGIVANNLALVFRRTDRLPKAEALFRRVLSIFEQIYGASHPMLGGTLNNLAQVLEHTGRLEEAEPLMRRAISIFETHLGSDHPNVAIALNNLAGLLETRGQGVRAEVCSRRHVEIFQAFGAKTGQRHAFLDAALENYQALLTRLGLPEAVVQQRVQAVAHRQPLQDLQTAAPEPSAPPDFDTLNREAYAPESALEDKERLYTALYRLPQWHFIARGELPNVHPYLAANPGIGNNVALLKAFTDTKKLHAFAAANHLTDAKGEVHVLSLPVPSIIPALEEYAKQGVWGVHFNADEAYGGFFAPVAQLAWIREHLTGNGLL